MKRLDVRSPVPIGCAFGDHDHQRHSPCSFPMLTVARLFDRRSRLCGSLLISLSANLCNTETILWSLDRGISRSRGATRSSESMFKRWEKEWKCCGEIRRERRCLHGLSNLKRINDSGIHYGRYIYRPYCGNNKYHNDKKVVDNTTINKIEIIMNNICKRVNSYRI